MLEILIVILGVALDQFSKFAAITWLQPLPQGDFALWPGVFHLTYVQNTGAAFGMLSGAKWLFIVVIAAVVVVLTVLLIKRRGLHTLLRVGMSLIIAGGIGNLIDRIFRGYVVDMLHFKLINFAVFNVADSCICVGVALLIIYLLFFESKNISKKPKHA